MTLENGTKRLSQNVGKESPLHTAQYLRRAWISHGDMAVQTMVWLLTVQFKEIWFGAVQFTTWFSNLDNLTHLSTKFKGKKPHLAFK